MRKLTTYIFAVAALTFLLSRCDKGTLKGNAAPDTKIAVGSINLSGQFRLNSVVELSWFGTDVDGYVSKYEISFDEQNWQVTTAQDSTFKFSIPAGSDTVDVYFYVRAIDDKGAVDPTPASLRIPLKNSIPSATFDADNYPKDSAITVTTYRWYGSDPDGDETITEAEMRWNDGDWYSIDPNQPLVTFVLDTNAPNTANVFYANNKFAQPNKINGLKLNDQNTLYLRVKDIANAYSIIDTAQQVFIKKPNSPFLVIAGQPQSVTNIYKPLLNGIGLAYDFVDYAKTDVQSNPVNQPSFWNPTFKHLIMQYEKVFVYADATLYNNPATGQSSMLLSFMSTGVQEFTDAGRKILVSTSFSNNSDMSSISGIYPIENIVISSGQVRITNDSAMYSVVTGPYPDLQPQNIIIGVVPIEKSADAEDFYRAQLTKLSGWQGDNLVGVRRKYNGNINHVFFGVGLYNFNKDVSKLEDLLEQILVNDFNW